MKNHFYLLPVIFFILLSCDKDDPSLNEVNLTDKINTQVQEAEILEKMFSEITALASSANCTDSSEWTFTSFGIKACGGPIGFIAFSKNIDTELILKKIEEHKIAQKKFIEKWNIFSTCDTPSEPKGVICENGNPVFEY